MEEILQKIKGVIEEKGIALAGDVNINTKLEDDLKMDMMDIVDVLMAVEDALDFRFIDDVHNRVKTVGDIVDEIEKLK